MSHPIIDLHMHSTASDGTDTPAALLSRVRAAGIHCFSVTDHDAFAACRKIRTLLQPDDPAFLFGIEFSCKDELGKYHVLGYGYDPQGASIRAVVALGHEYRMKKIAARLAVLEQDYGITFPEADVDALYAKDNPGKPHLAQLMVRDGYASSMAQAFSDVLNHIVIAENYVRPEEAIRGILGSGGIPVLAHPCFGDGEQRIFGEALCARVERLIGFGLAGLEGYYSRFSEAQRKEVLALAARFDLYVTAGSDYHGSNKSIQLTETGLSQNEELPNGLSRFLRDAFHM